MIRLTQLMNESKAAEKAKQMGLDYMQFGRWGKDGQVTHKSQGDTVVPVKQPAVTSKNTTTSKKPTVKKTPAKKPTVKKTTPSKAAPEEKPKYKTPEYITKLSSALREVYDKKDIPLVVNTVANIMGRSSPVKIKKPSLFAKARSALLKTQGKELLGTYDIDDDSISLYRNDTNQILSKSPKQWNFDDVDNFNVLVHESIHAASPRLKNVNTKKIKPAHMALEEGITEHISQLVTKRMQVDSGRGTYLIPSDSPYDNMARAFTYLDYYDGVDIENMFKSAKTSEMLADVVDKAGRTLLYNSFTKVFSEAEVGKILPILEGAILPDDKKHGVTLGLSILSPTIGNIIPLLHKNEGKSNKKDSILSKIGMTDDEIHNIIDKTGEVS